MIRLTGPQKMGVCKELTLVPPLLHCFQVQSEVSKVVYFSISFTILLLVSFMLFIYNCSTLEHREATGFLGATWREREREGVAPLMESALRRKRAIPS